MGTNKTGLTFRRVAEKTARLKVRPGKGLNLTLSQVLQGLQNKVCRKVAFTYGGQLCFHFGSMIPYDNQKLNGMLKGQWILNTCGTAWSAQTPDEWVTSDQDQRDAESRLQALVGRKVTLARICSRRLLVEFGMRFALYISPSTEDEKSGLPYWELFTPHHRVYSYGPGMKKSYRASNVPAS